MPKCGEKIEHTGNSVGKGFNRDEDDARAQAKPKARYEAVTDAGSWARKEISGCPEDCSVRRLTVVIDKIPSPVCVRKINPKDGLGYSVCEAKCTWHATLTCRKRHFRTPTDETGGRVDRGISEGRMTCDEDMWEKGTAEGEYPNEVKKLAKDSAKDEAMRIAYEKAAEKAKALRCPSSCPNLRVSISLGEPTDPTCEKDDFSNRWLCKSSCYYKIVVDCVDPDDG